MCGRFTLVCSEEELLSVVDQLPPGFRLEARYNIAPGQWAVVVRPEQGGRRISLAQWGLIPRWARDAMAGPRPFNARSEGVDRKPTFRAALAEGRCLVPASGFYEWRQMGGLKQPTYIRPTQGPLFWFAAILDRWKGPNGPLETLAILTTTPNGVMAAIHDRMPVILGPEQVAQWLDPAAPVAAVLPLLVPCPDLWLQAHPVGSRVGRVDAEGPELIAPAPEVASLGLASAPVAWTDTDLQ